MRSGPKTTISNTSRLQTPRHVGQTHKAQEAKKLEAPNQHLVNEQNTFDGSSGSYKPTEASAFQQFNAALLEQSGVTIDEAAAPIMAVYAEAFQNAAPEQKGRIIEDALLTATAKRKLATTPELVAFLKSAGAQVKTESNMSLQKAAKRLLKSHYGTHKLVPPSSTTDMTQKGYSLEKMNMGSYLSMVAYEKPEVITQTLERLGFDPASITHINNPKTDTHGFVAKDKDGNIFTSFRGTASAKNVITDVKFRRRNANWSKQDMSVHRGFDAALDSVWPEVRDAISKAKGEGDGKLVLTGHSLGAAISQLAAARSIEEGLVKGEDITLVTIGSPRPGNKAFAKYLDRHVSDSFRIVNKRAGDSDLVTAVPPKFLGYEHSGTEVQLSDEGDKRIAPPVLESTVFLMRVGASLDARDQTIESVETAEDWTAILDEALKQENDAPLAEAMPNGLIDDIKLHSSEGYTSDIGKMLIKKHA